MTILTDKCLINFKNWCVDKNNKITNLYDFKLNDLGDLVFCNINYFQLPIEFQFSLILVFFELKGISIGREDHLTYWLESTEDYGNENENYIFQKTDSLSEALIKSNTIYNITYGK